MLDMNASYDKVHVAKQMAPLRRGDLHGYGYKHKPSPSALKAILSCLITSNLRTSQYLSHLSLHSEHSSMPSSASADHDGSDDIADWKFDGFRSTEAER